MQKSISHAVILAKKKTFDRLEDVRVFPFTHGNGAIFIVASIESNHENKKLRNELLDELALQLDALVQHPAPEKDAEPRFEEHMQKLNEHMGEWLLAHPNAVDIPRSGLLVASLTESTLLLTGFGHIASIYLHTKGEGDEAHDLVRELRRESAPEQSKLFRTVMMGVLEPGDRALFGNTAMLRLMPKEQLADILTELPVQSAAEKISMQSEPSTESIIGFVLKCPETQARIIQTSAKISVEELHRAEARTEHVLTRSPRNAKELTSNAARWFKKMLAEGFSLVFATLLSLLILLSSSLRALCMMPFGAGHREKAKKQFHEVLMNCKHRIKEKNQALTWPMRIIFLLLFALFVWAGLSGMQSWKQKKVIADQAAIEAVITSIRSLESDAEAKLIYNDDVGAKAALDAADASLATHRSSLATLPAYQELTAALAKMRKDLRKEFALTLQPAWSLPSMGLRLGIMGGKPTAITQKGEVINDTGISAASSLTPHFAWFGQDALYATDANGAVSSIAADGTTKTLQGILPNTLVDATMYSGRVYGLNTAASAIVRVDPLSGGFGSAKVWQKGEVKSLAEARSIAIDTDVYVATKNDILKFNRGFSESFTLGGIDPSPADIQRIWTSETSSFIYILESSKHRVVMIDKGNGAYVKQYLFDGTEGVTDFLVDETANQLFLLAEKQVFKGAL